MAAVLEQKAEIDSIRRPAGEAVSRRHTLVVGLGATGLAAARHLAALDKQVIVIDSRADPPGLAALTETQSAIRVELETLDSKWLTSAERIVLSPGLSADLPLVADAKRRGITVVSEIELFAEVVQAPTIAVTGSNGKSTVVSMTADIMAGQGFNVPRGGNLGPPALELLEIPDADLYVLEISSFQMEFTQSFKPDVAAVINVSPDHIDRHGSFEHYIALKASLLAQAKRAVYNWDDPFVRAMGQAHDQATPFSVHRTLERGWSVIDHRGDRWLAHDGKRVIASSALAQPGLLGESNSLAALALAESFGGQLEPALDALRRFSGLPHRCQSVAERNGIHYIDDSKGTNVGATVAAIEAMPRSVVLIAGGQGKGADFSPLAAAGKGRLRAAILLGDAAKQLESALSAVCKTETVADMQAAVTRATFLADRGDTVLLSPACASQDMYRDYRDRGMAFQNAVRELAP